MRLVSYLEADGRERVGVERGGEVHALPAGLTMPALLALGPRVAVVIGEEAAAGPAAGRVGELRLLPPVPHPGKLLCLAGNYQEHVKEGGRPAVEKARSVPLLFLKPGTCLSPPGGTVKRSRMTDRLDYECELAIVIGRTAADVSETEAMNYVGGYTIANDVSSRRLLHDDRDPDAPRGERERFFDWLVGKWQDGSLPLGPALVTPDEAGDGSGLRLTLDVNGERRQDGNTGKMIFSVASLIAYVSRFMSLRAGDVISTGTPAGVGHGAKPPRYLKPGDVVEMGITGLGTQRHTIVESK
jgi:2-keto-4-pentenoate hydratase/2-oxohepta-3-ene-1,7-dioic acid hydratase in catechol pathway